MSAAVVIACLFLLWSGPFAFAESNTNPSKSSSRVLMSSKDFPPLHTGRRVPEQCSLRTKKGVCVEEFLAAVDAAYADKWPGTVDVLLRTHLSDNFFLLQALLQSLELMWPKGIGELVLVLDKGETDARGLLPSWVKVMYEENYLQIPGKFLQQWSYGWADNYTTADYVAIIDDDMVFNVKVAPQLLFNLTTRRPYVIGNYRQLESWVNTTTFLVGKEPKANFMVQLPVIFPRKAFPQFREHVGKLHPEHGGTYDGAFKWWTQGWKKDRYRIFVQHTAIGNFLYYYHPDEVEVVMEWLDSTAIPRTGVHIPYTEAYRLQENGPKTGKRYVNVASQYAQEALCFTFPRGEIPGCLLDEDRQDQIWKYVYKWNDWHNIYKEPTAEGTKLYDKHIKEIHCMYEQFLAKKAFNCF